MILAAIKVFPVPVPAMISWRRLFEFSTAEIISLWYGLNWRG
ncbi:hypothetical protein CWATWH0402_6303 [Crocosphaera watsonii WH 0402]|uniref:Uncharacterized protein n=1 Tax=Crocosphaera watsonii WH 0402 TaxID=1284629 RepID=T2K0N2_CROWT|nr:hypothetical protein CWATWH0402_6303 [Crocosphaera watsonii WH 0402]